MLGEAFVSTIGAAAQELAGTLAYRWSELARRRRMRGLRHIPQFVVFGVLVVALFAVIGLLLTLGLSWLAA